MILLYLRLSVRVSQYLICSTFWISCTVGPIKLICKLTLQKRRKCCWKVPARGTGHFWQSRTNPWKVIFQSVGCPYFSWLWWDTHIEYIISKSVSRLYLLKQLKRSSLAPPSHILHFYTIVIRDVYCNMPPRSGILLWLTPMQSSWKLSIGEPSISFTVTFILPLILPFWHGWHSNSPSTTSWFYQAFFQEILSTR